MRDLALTVDLAPVEEAVLDEGAGSQLAVDVLVIDEVEQLLEENAVGEFGRELFDLRLASLGENLVHDGFDVCFVHLV